MREKKPLPALVVGTLVAVLLCTVMMDGGWWIWVPVLLALFVMYAVWTTLGRG